MNDTNHQDDFLKDMDFERIHILLKPEHKEYLKNIDSTNMSNAIRSLIETHMQQTRLLKIERHALIIMVFLILLLGVYQIVIL